MKLNKKGGYAGPLVDAMAYLVWVLIIIFAIMLLNLRSCSGGNDGTSTLPQGWHIEINDYDLLKKYDATTLNECTSELKSNENLNQMTFKELINLIIKKKTSKEDFNNYLNLWGECTKEYFNSQRKIPTYWVGNKFTNSNKERTNGLTINIKEYYMGGENCKYYTTTYAYNKDSNNLDILQSPWKVSDCNFRGNPILQNE